MEAAARGVIPPENLLILRWVRKDKEEMILWTEHRLVPIHDASGNLVAIEGIARDITERKQMEEVLRENSEHLRSLATRLAEVEEAETTAVGAGTARPAGLEPHCSEHQPEYGPQPVMH